MHQQQQQQQAVDIETPIRELEQLSQAARLAERHDPGVATLYRYLAQLHFVCSRFPVDENQVRVAFSWTEVFAKLSKKITSAISIGKKNVSYSVLIEKAAIMFNIAALQSLLGASQNMNSDAGLVAANNYFQQAAGSFSALREFSLSNFHGLTPIFDYNADLLELLSMLMLAQAQECFLVKATMSKMKDLTLAKLASQVADYYDKVEVMCRTPTIVDVLDKSWEGIARCKKVYNTALSQFHAAAHCRVQSDWGVEVGRLTYALTLFQETAKACKERHVNIDVTNYVHKVQRGLETAVKENNLIYHEKVPSAQELPVIERMAMVKPAPMKNLTDPNVAGRDLFGAIVPFEVQRLVQQYCERRDQLLQSYTARVEELNNLQNSTLTSMNLPAAIEALDQSHGALPAALAQKAAHIREKGGFDALQARHRDLLALAQNNADVLAEAIRLLDEEEADDVECRKRYGTDWRRTPSGQLTQKLREDADKYRNVVEKARGSDQIVADKIASNQVGIQRLAKSDAELAASLPAGSQARQVSSPSVSLLKGLLSQLDALKANRARLQEQQEAAMQNDDITPVLVENPEVNVESLSQERLQAIYGFVQSQLDHNAQEQERLLDQARTAKDRFDSETMRDDSQKQRENALAELDAAFNAYEEVSSNIEEGSRFYGQMADLLVKLQSKCSDFCFARKTEKADLVADFQKEVTKPENPAQSFNAVNRGEQYASSVRQPSAVPPPGSVSAGAGGRGSVPPPTVSAAPPRGSTSSSSIASAAVQQPPPQQYQPPSAPPPFGASAPPSYGVSAPGPQSYYTAPPPQQQQPYHPSQSVYQSNVPPPSQPQYQPYGALPPQPGAYGPPRPTYGFAPPPPSQQGYYGQPPDPYYGYTPQGAPPAGYYGQPQYAPHGAPYAAPPYQQPGGYQPQAPGGYQQQPPPPSQQQRGSQP